MSANRMVLDNQEAYLTGTEMELMERLLPLSDCRVLELGCGSARITRRLARAHPDCHFIANEVDSVQHEKNLGDTAGNISFRLEGAQSIGEPDQSVDVVLMLKSLHHVPGSVMPQAMSEVARVLKPGGIAYFSEPVYQGEFNALMSLIHDEKRVRELAFKTIQSLSERDDMELLGQYFLNVPGLYGSWESFESRFLNITHTKLKIDKPRYRQIKTAFMEHMGPRGAEFLKPHRIDLLRKRNIR
ncbi:MAG: class I SAM-dependent methyltransferase [Candidatus Thiodiazotropha endolucinida]|nr:class I SAM-dependent methyltransferase [Candidatus Thiodiazotropha sp. (ex Lucina pensylvanica)]MCG8024101.1 class I SAM-dependent methyltransferase [Candidatus Thiodiazotropha endolucinida]